MKRDNETMRSKKGRMIAAVVVLGGIMGLSFASGNVTAQMPLPKDFSYEETKPLAPVPFSHKFHVSEKNLSCGDCHIKPKLFEMKRLAASPEMNMAKINAGAFCGACHNGNKAFSSNDPKTCTRCHVKK